MWFFFFFSQTVRQWLKENYFLKKNNNSSILASRKMMMKNLRTWDKVSWKAASLLSSLKPKLDDQVCYQLLSDPVPLKLPGCTKRDFLISCFYHLKELKSDFSVQQAACNRLNVLSSQTAHEHERGQKWVKAIEEPRTQLVREVLAKEEKMVCLYLPVSKSKKGPRRISALSQSSYWPTSVCGYHS